MTKTTSPGRTEEVGVGYYRSNYAMDMYATLDFSSSAHMSTGHTNTHSHTHSDTSPTHPRHTQKTVLNTTSQRRKHPKERITQHHVADKKRGIACSAAYLTMHPPGRSARGRTKANSIVCLRTTKVQNTIFIDLTFSPRFFIFRQVMHFQHPNTAPLTNTATHRGHHSNVDTGSTPTAFAASNAFGASDRARVTTEACSQVREPCTVVLRSRVSCPPHQNHPHISDLWRW